MSLVVKSIVAFCIGIFVVAAVQTVGMMSLKQYLQSDRAMTAGVPVMGAAIPTIDAGGLKEAMLPKVPPIDTATGQRLAIEGAARRVDQQVRGAQDAVPLPRSSPGMR